MLRFVTTNIPRDGITKVGVERRCELCVLERSEKHSTPTTQISDWLIFHVQHLPKARQVEIDHDGAVNVKTGGGAVTVGPGFHLLHRAGGGDDIHLGVGQVMLRQPGARVLAVGAPFGAIHYDPAVGQRHWFRLLRFRAVAHCGVDLADSAAQLVIGWLQVNIVHIHITDDALFVDDKERAFGHAFVLQHAVALGYRAVRPEVAQQRVGDTAEVFCPCRQAGHGVNTDTQNLGVQSRETGHFGFV